MNRIFIIHGWNGFPENHWFPWLKKELERLNFKVIIPAMPNPSEPKIEEWVSYLNQIVRKPDANTYFVGHSIGCQAIMRYLAKINNNTKVGGVVFVAGFFNLPFLRTKEEKNIANHWLKTKINTNNIKRHTKNIIALFSNNDPDVSLKDAALFKQKLNAKIIVEQNKGHFTLETGVAMLPSVINSIKEMTS